MKAPWGESVQLTQPDGTNIKLNCGSVLKFSNLFGYQDRVVELNGEGYFDVNKSNLKFVVATKELNLEVLGTKFNISAYDSDRIVNANLYEGKVAITNKILRERVVLNPSESYSYDKISKKSKYKTFNKDLTWLDNYFVADRDDIEEFVKKIERKYKVQIIIDPNLIGKCTYTGVFKGESLKEVLDNMVIASHIEYYLDDKGAVYINKRKTKI